jgi:hypothetical protein
MNLSRLFSLFSSDSPLIWGRQYSRLCQGPMASSSIEPSIVAINKIRMRSGLERSKGHVGRTPGNIVAIPL